MYRDPVYFARRKLIEGEDTGQAIMEEDENEDGESVHNQNESNIGIPGFWMRVFLSSKNLMQIVQVKYLN